jgi:hypothetical protein
MAYNAGCRIQFCDNKQHICVADCGLDIGGSLGGNQAQKFSETTSREVLPDSKGEACRLGFENQPE